VKLKTVSKYALIVSGIALFFFLYLFFRLVFNFWLSDIVAVVPAGAAAYLITAALMRSKMSDTHKLLAVIVILVAVGAFVVELLALQITLNKLYLIINENN